MDAQPKRAPWLWPLALVAGGVVLLLDNFLLIEVNVLVYWPALLIVLGLQLLVRGDIAPTWHAHTFGITRGSVQSASLEIESGELDVQVRALRKPGRLVAGQYTARSRPGLMVRNNRATLRMQRGQTWWLSLADWDVGLAQDLPWSLLLSSYLGHLEVDLRDLVVERAYIASGLGQITLVCPAQARVVFARSTFGDVRLVIPEDSRVILRTRTGPFGRLHIDRNRFDLIEPGLYVSVMGQNLDESSAPAPELTVIAQTVFGAVITG